nr:hypothetical protein [uncultured Gulosibacter sp.]
MDVEPTDISITAVLDNLIAALGAEQIDRVIVYGSPYGNYLAVTLGARYPDRIAGMILDSTMIDTSSQRAAADSLNEFYWHGTAARDGHAARVRTLVEREIITAGTAGFPLHLLHESGGPALVASILALLERGKGARAGLGCSGSVMLM